MALTHISPAYTEQLQKLSQMSEEDILAEETVSRIPQHEFSSPH